MEQSGQVQVGDLLQAVDKVSVHNQTMEQVKGNIVGNRSTAQQYARTCTHASTHIHAHTYTTNARTHRHTQTLEQVEGPSWARQI